MKIVVREFVKIIRKYNLSYDQFNQAAREAREECDLKVPTRRHRSTKLPTMEDIRNFFRIVEEKSLVDKLLMKILLYMGLRTCELVNIEIRDLDFSVSGKEKVFVHRKGGLDREFVIPDQLVDLLKLYISTAAKDQKYLFESDYRKKYTERAIRKKFMRYRKDAGISENVTPHSFRRAIITYLSSAGWSTRQIKLVSGHESTSSVDIYDHTNSESIRVKLNESISNLEKDLLER